MINNTGRIFDRFLKDKLCLLIIRDRSFKDIQIQIDGCYNIFEIVDFNTLNPYRGINLSLRHHWMNKILDIYDEQYKSILQ
jgi:hypothetical protein